MEKRDQVNGSRSRGAALESERLSRVVGEKVLVNEISVQVHVGEVLAVVGPSGSGKTSFLRLLNRLDEPTGGIVRFNGRDYRELAPPELRRRIGMVMQAAFLFPGTVAGNVAYGPHQRGQPLSRFGVGYILDKYLKRAQVTVPTLREKRLHPHSMRHSTAVHLLKSGVDLSTIGQWLGHASLNTTNKYATIDLDLKRQALALADSPATEALASWRHDATILEWLESL